MRCHVVVFPRVLLVEKIWARCQDLLYFLLPGILDRFEEVVNIVLIVLSWHRPFSWLGDKLRRYFSREVFLIIPFPLFCGTGTILIWSEIDKSLRIGRDSCCGSRAGGGGGGGTHGWSV